MNYIYQKLKKDTLRYLFISGLVVVFDAIRSIVIANMLGPYFMGVCLTLMTLLPISRYMNLGLIDSMLVLLPRYKERKEAKKAFRIQQTIYTSTAIIHVMLVLGICIYVILWSKESAEINTYIILCSFFSLLGQSKRFLLSVQAASSNFQIVGNVEFVYSCFLLVLQVLLVHFFRGYGFWVALIFLDFALIVYLGKECLKNNDQKFLKFEPKILRSILPIAVAMMFVGANYVPFSIVARILLAKFASLKEVGLFVPAMMVISKLSVVSSAVTRVFLPSISRLQAEGEDINTSFRIFIKAQFLTLCVVTILCLVGFWFLEDIVGLIMPQYTPGIPAAKFALVACIPFCLVENANNYLLVLQCKRVYAGSLLVGLILLCLALSLLGLSRDITATNVSGVLFFVFLIYACMINLRLLLVWKARGREGPQVANMHSPQEHH